ncbi:MAG TPA: hypothetical protein VN670_10575, partial [Acidobacteriaceae bacterium]|nr:hypothetical protein [Acidobacteriaceae bacterium]
EQVMVRPAAGELRTRVMELGAALFQSIRMQLAVERYYGEAVERAANLGTLDSPVTDVMWLRRQILDIRKMDDPMAQIAAVHSLLFRTDPGPGGFYDQLGDVSNRPHLVLGPRSRKDADFRQSPQIGFLYPDVLQDKVPIAWKCWAGSLYDAPLTMQYRNMDTKMQYKVRVVYMGRRFKIGLMANDTIQIHPYIGGITPGERHQLQLPAPQEFPIPQEATANGELKLSWTREPGLGGSGTGCNVAEVWLIPASTEKAS